MQNYNKITNAIMSVCQTFFNYKYFGYLYVRKQLLWKLYFLTLKRIEFYFFKINFALLRCEQSTASYSQVYCKRSSDIKVIT